jgi:Putative peptidoglycan binding domain
MARRQWLFLVVALVVIAAGVAIVVGRDLDGRRGSRSVSATDTGSATSLATVQRRSLSTETQFNGTLGYAGWYPVLGPARGTVTWLPHAGQVIGEGQVLYRVDGAPVVLLYGSTPAYRALGVGGTAADVTGPDVAQLNHDLVALGYMHRADATPAWDEFTWATQIGVQRLQRHLGLQRTGRLDRGAVVFVPTAARVAALHATLGGPANGPVLTATSTSHAVHVALDVDLRSSIKVGDRVTITLPDDSATPGVVSSIGTVATISSNNAGDAGGSAATVPVTILPVHPNDTGGLDQALVQVAITDRTVRDVLAVPVTALLALSGDRYAVEVVAGDGTHHQVRVTPGLFDDAAGLVQVSGSGLVAGQRVVVPGNE